MRCFYLLLLLTLSILSITEGKNVYKRQATSVTSAGNAVVANNGTTTIAQNTTVASVVTTTATLNVSSEPTTTNDTSATEIAVIVSSETPVQTTTDGTDATVVAVVVSTVTSEQSTTDEAESTNASQETTTRSYVDEPITLKPNYVDEPHVPNKGKSSSAYNGNEQKGDQVSQSGQYGNIKVVPSGYRSKRASEYVDENITPSHGDEGDSYEPVGEENPAPIEQGYPDNEAPPVESNGYGDYDDNSGQTTRAVRRTTSIIRRTTTPVRRTTTPVRRTTTPVIRTTRRIPSTTRRPQVTRTIPQRTTSRPYVTRPTTRNSNYADEPYVPEQGNSEGSYTGGEEEGQEVSQGENYGNPNVEPSGYRRKRASEYVDENITPSHGGEGDSYEPIGEENPAPIEQGYPDNEAPPVESNGYGDYDDNSGQTTRAVRRTTTPVRRTTTPVRRTTTPVRRTTTPVIRTTTPVIRTTRRISSTTRRPQVTRTIPQRTTSRPYVTRPTTRNGNYADEPYVPEQGNSEGSYTGGEEEGQEVSQGENYGNPNVEPSGYRRKRASEYVDENITPSHGGEGDSYQPAGEENPTPIDQTYADNQAPPLEPAGY